MDRPQVQITEFRSSALRAADSRVRQRVEDNIHRIKGFLRSRIRLERRQKLIERLIHAIGTRAASVIAARIGVRL